MDSECASGCTWSTARQQPVSGTANPGVVQQDKSSRGSIDTAKTHSGPQRVRMSIGERPTGAAKGKQSDTEALCQPRPDWGEAGNRHGESSLLWGYAHIVQCQGISSGPVSHFPTSDVVQVTVQTSLSVSGGG